MSGGKIRGALDKMKQGAGNLVSVDTPQRGNRFDRLTEYFENHPVARYVVPIVVLLLAGTAVFLWTASIREGQQSIPEGFSIATPAATGKESDGSLGQAPGNKYQLPMEGKLLEANQIAPNEATGEIDLPQTQDLLVFSGAFARVGFSMTETASFEKWYDNMKSYYMPFRDMTGSGWSADNAHPGWDDTPYWASDFSSPGRPALVLNKTSTVVGIWADKELYDFQVDLKIGEETEGGAGTHLVRVALENTTTLFDGRTTTENVTLEMVVACSPWVGTEDGCRGFTKEELSAGSYSNSNSGFWVYANTDRYSQPLHTK
jgi:hypothetical protein